MADPYDYDIGIIGGGAAGLTVASGSAQLGAKTLLIENEEKLGGDCLHYGCVPSKTLIHSARVYHLMKSGPRFGLPRVEVPPVVFGDISRRIRSVIDTIQQHDSEERFCSLGARVEFGQARFVDERTVVLNGRKRRAKTWVIATGSSPIVPPIPGLDETPHITNREIFYLDHLPESMIFLGAGPIGVEMAQAFNRLGSRVTVVDRAEQILPREDPDFAAVLSDVLEVEGVRFVLGSAIETVRDRGGFREVTVSDARGKQRTLQAQTLVVALGRRANVDGLGLEEIGVAYTPRGISVDDRLRTSHKHIYAAGDVNGGFQFTHAAGYEGGIVVTNAVFRLPRKVDYTFLPWCTYTEPELASIGMNETAAREKGIAYTVIQESFKDNDRSLAEAETVGSVKMLLDGKEKPIGVQILGPRAGDLVAEWAAVLNGRVKLSTLAAAVHPYPTLAEINKKVAGSYLSPKIFSEKVQKGLKFFFQLKGRACHTDAESSR